MVSRLNWKQLSFYCCVYCGYNHSITGEDFCKLQLKVLAARKEKVSSKQFMLESIGYFLFSL